MILWEDWSATCRYRALCSVPRTQVLVRLGAINWSNRSVSHSFGVEPWRVQLIVHEVCAALLLRLCRYVEETTHHPVDTEYAALFLGHRSA